MLFNCKFIYVEGYYISILLICNILVILHAYVYNKRYL